MAQANEELDRAVLNILMACVNDERQDRQALLAELRRYELLFAGYQSLWFNYDLLSWSTWQMAAAADPSIGAPDKYTKVINILRAHVESIVAAVGSDSPKTPFSPVNSNDPEDVVTSESYTMLSKLIDVHNSSPMLFLRMLFILYTQGPLFLYNYFKKDKAYGLHKVEKESVIPVQREDQVCTECGEIKESDFCEYCRADTGTATEMADDFMLKTEEDYYPKGREIIEVYGQFHVKIPSWVTKQSETPYLLLIGEFPTALIQSLYPEKADKLGPSEGDQSQKDYTGPIERQYVYRETNTVYRGWVRPWQYYARPKEERDLLKKNYPDGIYGVFVEGMLLEAWPEEMDAHWTFLENKLSNRIHFEPLAKPIIPIQQMVNEAVNMTWERVEKGIPLTIIDKNTINPKQLMNRPQEVGEIIVASVPAGDSLSNKIQQTRTTDLPPEIMALTEQLLHLGEFLLGSVPGIWGGQNKEGSKTLGESERTRATALQRLNLYWRFAREAWNTMKLKACDEFRQLMVGDEMLSMALGNSIQSIPIRKMDMKGRVQSVYAETTESFPQTWVETSERMFTLIRENNESLNTAIFDLENVDRVKRATGFPDFFVPGEDQRNLQLKEIIELLRAAPNPDGSPSIMPDPDIDNLQIHISTCQNWLASPMGQWQKENNPEGYANVKAHLQMHKMMAQAAPTATPSEPVPPTSETQPVAPPDQALPVVPPPQEAGNAGA